MNASTTPLNPMLTSTRRWFHLDSEFRDELKNLLLRATPSSLVLLDTNGSLFGLDDTLNCQRLDTWLSGSPLAQVRIVTFDEWYLSAHAAPFQHLRALKSSQIHWRLVPQGQQHHIQQALALCKEGLIKKPVREAFHGFSDDDPKEVNGLLDYFEKIWHICEPAPSLHTLGL